MCVRVPLSETVQKQTVFLFLEEPAREKVIVLTKKPWVGSGDVSYRTVTRIGLGGVNAY